MAPAVETEVNGDSKRTNQRVLFGWFVGSALAARPNTKYFLCPFAVYYLRYAVTSFFTISRIYLADGKRTGQKVHRKIAAAVQNVKSLYFLSRYFEIREKYSQESFFLS